MPKCAVSGTHRLFLAYIDLAFALTCSNAATALASDPGYSALSLLAEKRAASQQRRIFFGYFRAIPSSSRQLSGLSSVKPIAGI